MAFDFGKGREYANFIPNFWSLWAVFELRSPEIHQILQGNGDWGLAAQLGCFSGIFGCATGASNCLRCLVEKNCWFMCLTSIFNRCLESITTNHDHVPRFSYLFWFVLTSGGTDWWFTYLFHGVLMACWSWMIPTLSAWPRSRCYCSGARSTTRHVLKQSPFLGISS